MDLCFIRVITKNNNKMSDKIDVKVIPGGPLMVHGTCEVTHADGTKETKETRSTYCRCGASANKPFCDGKHKGLEWNG